MLYDFHFCLFVQLVKFVSCRALERFVQATETQSKKVLIQQAGTYELGFGIVDLSDTVVDSGLVIDDVKLTSTGVSPFSTESLTVEGADSAISPEVDFVLTSNGLETFGGSSNTR